MYLARPIQVEADTVGGGGGGEGEERAVRVRQCLGSAFYPSASSHVGFVSVLLFQNPRRHGCVTPTL